MDHASPAKESHTYACTDDHADSLPNAWRDNLVWELDGDFAFTDVYEFCRDTIDGDGWYIYTSMSATLETGSMLADPRFESDPVLGTYALAADSPARAAGRGPDGSVDLGAFGGPTAELAWGDFFWPLPWSGRSLRPLLACARRCPAGRGVSTWKHR